MAYFSDDIPEKKGDWFIDSHGEYIHRMEFARPPYEKINAPLWEAIQKCTPTRMTASRTIASEAHR